VIAQLAKTKSKGRFSCMNRYVSKIMASLVLSSMIFSMVACNPNSAVQTGGSTKDNVKKTLKLWHIWAADTEAQKKPFEKILSDFQTANPNIKLEVDAVENETYKTKIKTAVAANEAPDIFFTWGAGSSKPYVQSKSVLPLDEYLKDGTKDKISQGTLDNFTYDGKIYGLPMYMWSAVLYCNKELFDKHNVKIPDTFDELLAAVETFKSNNVIPITAGEKERWPGMFFQNILAIRTAGVKLCQSALKGEESFDKPEFVESAAKLKELVKAGAFDEGVMALTKDEAEAAFKQGKVAMYYMGNWFAGPLDDDNSRMKGKIVCKNFPSIKGSKGDSDAFLGGSIETFMVSANTSAKEEAVKTVKYISENMSNQASIVGYGLPAWKGEIDKSKLKPIYAQITDLVKQSKGFVLAWDTFLEPADAEVHLDLVARIFEKNSSMPPEQFAKEMQKLNGK
jgi:raffinose/stachyose/melibiose transport system substrate-binding protein